ncbi:type VI secretion system ATPase TssH [Citrobacter braakii]|uniref:type VI secretion system ATPase TssH n=1 Tax=Citrobacter braakii TaxID=57706 RepID=UPI000CDD198D|nr:type VI secretion system ATPase TssH [Citrobacter braakii]POT29234.1 type VI secretion system ATPase TssH [Citrobacter braakii]POT34093.1 type VI secretion system ATPase TssH [Citrobacter braakii]POT38918.1 type VI secretion system ATPase TssH [Citrobacter braakii]POU80461.1 type VI secretion system ATPase TssH [Citrobacter braakii]POV06437.1 type VI secretion system ATPase TssH [Citrobacter braakii]
MSNYLKNIIDKLTQESRTCLNTAVSHAVSHGHRQVESEHLILAIISHQSYLMERLNLTAGLSTDVLLRSIQQALSNMRGENNQAPVFSIGLVQWLEKSWLHASASWGHTQLTPAALLVCLLDEDHVPDLYTSVRNALNCNREKAEALLLNASLPSERQALSDSEVNHSALRKFTRNLSEQARDDRLDPVLGREAEIRQVIDILLRRRQNNPILTGEPGVGKTALIEGLAQRIADGSVPEALSTMEVLSLDLGLLQAGASVKGEFESRLQMLMDEIINAPHPIILFIDEAHRLIGAGGQAGQNDAANLLKPVLARGELRVIAATTWAEYKKYFEKDAALTRRFQLVTLAEPTIESATAMLRAVAPAMSRHHGVQILESAIHAAISLSNRYIAGRQLPDKSVSLLDTACARVSVSQCHQPKEIEQINAQLNNLRSERDALQKEGAHQKRLAMLDIRESELLAELSHIHPLWEQQKTLVKQLQESSDMQAITQWRSELARLHEAHPLVFECVDRACVADVVSDWTGVPLGRMVEKEPLRLNELLYRLEHRVIGQHHALLAIARQIRISRANLNDQQKPTGVYLLAGPSGIGKTETALALADLLYGGEQSIVTINMSEYQEGHSISGLKGSPPGYVGYGEGGVLTEAVKRNPYSIVLLDEVEKAHPDVMELFYQVFDKGILEDGEGQLINFRNTLIIMTSNLGSAKIVMACTEGNPSPETLCSLVRPEFEQVFRPALMGRISLIPYLPLTPKTLEQIIRLKLDKICQRYHTASHGEVQLSYSVSVVTWIAGLCQVNQSGARDIDQVLNQHTLPLLADQLLQEDKIAKDNLKLGIKNNKLVLWKNNEKK